MEQWLPKAPEGLPTWVPWAILGMVLLAWILDRFVSRPLSIKGLAIKNKKDALDLVRDERDLWQNQAERLEKELGRLTRHLHAEELVKGNMLDRGKEADEQGVVREKSATVPETSEERKEVEAFESATQALSNGEYETGMALLRQSVADEKDDHARLNVIAFGHYYAYSHGTTNALSELQKLAENNANYQTTSWLARAYQHAGQVDEAITALEFGLSIAQDEGGRVTLAIQLFDVLTEAEREVQALKRLTPILVGISQPHLKAALYKKVAEFYERKQDFWRAFILYERALYHDPSDTDLRFHVAYEYMEQDAPEFSLYHYKKLLSVKPDDPMSLNNAGVAAGELGMPIASVSYFKQSSELGNTLASSNLAFKLIGTGFIDEADTILSRAVAQAEIDDRVYSAKAEIAKSRAEEDRISKNSAKKAETARKWRLAYAEAMLQEIDPNELAGEYNGKPGKLKLISDGNGKLQGEFFYPNGKSPAQFKGELEGRGIRISWNWKPPQNNVPSKGLSSDSYILSKIMMASPSEISHSGFLVFDRGILKGFSSTSSPSLDAATDIGSIEWHLKKQ